MQDPVLIKMLEVAPSEEGEGGHRETTTSAKEAFSKGGIESPSFQGGEEDRFRSPGGQGLKAGNEIRTERSCAGESPGRTVSPEESALQRAVSKKGEFCNRGHPYFISKGNRSFHLVVRISAHLSTAHLLETFVRR